MVVGLPPGVSAATGRTETRIYYGVVGDVATVLCSESPARDSGEGWGGVCLSVFPGETVMDVVIKDAHVATAGARYQWEIDTDFELTVLSKGTICGHARLAVPERATVLLVQLGVVNNEAGGMACGLPSPATEGVVTATVT